MLAGLHMQSLSHNRGRSTKLWVLTPCGGVGCSLLPSSRGSKRECLHLKIVKDRHCEHYSAHWRVSQPRA